MDTGRCRMFTVDTLTFHPPPTPPAVFKLSSPSFIVHYSRQSMSRGGKLAPEVNRCVRPSPPRVPRQGKAMTANSHDPCANMTFLQSSLRKEPEVSCTSIPRRPCRLTSPQLQRHPRGTLRPLWQVRPRAVCRLFLDAPAHARRCSRLQPLTARQPNPPGHRQQHKGHCLCCL